MAKTYVVTGAGRGLGAEFARQLEGRGETVIGASRPAVDVTDMGGIRNFARKLGPVDVLINNAGRQCRASTLEELDFDELKDTFDVNTFGPLRVTRALLENLRQGGRKLIVNVTSRMGCFAEYDGPSMQGYRASKAALNMFHRCIADELADEGFTTVALHPGWVRTDMGGADATLSAEESVTAMLAVLDNVTPADNGAILDWRGERLGW